MTTPSHSKRSTCVSPTPTQGLSSPKNPQVGSDLPSPCCLSRLKLGLSPLFHPPLRNAVSSWSWAQGSIEWEQGVGAGATLCSHPELLNRMRVAAERDDTVPGARFPGCGPGTPLRCWGTKWLTTLFLESGAGRKSPQPGPPALNSNDSGSVSGGGAGTWQDARLRALQGEGCQVPHGPQPRLRPTSPHFKPGLISHPGLKDCWHPGFPQPQDTLCTSHRQTMKQGVISSHRGMAMAQVTHPPTAWHWDSLAGGRGEESPSA